MNVNDRPQVLLSADDCLKLILKYVRRGYQVLTELGMLHIL